MKFGMILKMWKKSQLNSENDMENTEENTEKI